MVKGKCAILPEHIFKINQRVEVALSKDYNVQHYTSRIEERLPDRLVLAMPMSKGYPVLLESNREFYGKVFTDTGVYWFRSVYYNKRMQPLPVWIVSLPYDIKKIQQRAFVRFDVALPASISFMLSPDQEEPTTIKTVTKDLSGGGVQVVSEMPLHLGTKLQVEVEVPEHGLVQAVGEVIRVFRPVSDRKLFWLAVKFTDIQENARDKIIRFIFKKQLEQRQKGL